MTLARAFAHQLESSPMTPATPIVFVVDDDISVREVAAVLINAKAGIPETFASAQEFLDRHETLFRAV